MFHRLTFPSNLLTVTLYGKKLFQLV